MQALATELAVTVLAPLFFGSVALIHGLRAEGARHDIGRSVLIAGGIWSAIALGTALLVTLLVGPLSGW
jgi:Na+/H+-dicarboxylate symporter